MVHKIEVLLTAVFSGHIQKVKLTSLHYLQYNRTNNRLLESPRTVDNDSAEEFTSHLIRHYVMSEI